MILLGVSPLMKLFENIKKALPSIREIWKHDFFGNKTRKVFSEIKIFRTCLAVIKILFS